MESQLYQKIEEILKESKIDARLKQSKEDKADSDMLHVFLGTDSEGRESILHLIVNEYAAPKELLKDAPTKVSIEFHMEFPIQFTAYTMIDVVRLIAFLNVSVEMPGFYVSEIDDAIGFRYVWIGDEKGIDRHLILGILGSISIMRDLYLGVIEEVALGKQSLETILEQIEEVTREVFRG